jgi:hypothetical protein
MLHIKSFESMNYGTTHFGTPIFNFFPWFDYPKSISELPKLDKEMYELVRSLCPNRFQHMIMVWFPNESYFTTNLRGSSFMKSRPIYVKPENGEVYYDGNENNVDDWEDIEKIRLMLNIGKKSEVKDYLEFLETLEDFSDAILYLKEDNPKIEISASTTGNILTKSGGEINIATDEDVLDFVRKYDGKERFFYSLKDYLTKWGKLSLKQIETARPEASKYMIDDQPGILVKDFDINKPTSKRLRYKGYSTVEIGDDLLVFKPKQK